MSSAHPVILDVDTGIDDAWAIYLALRSPRLEPLGITTVFGNGDLATTTHNTLLMLELLASDVAVYPGADRPLMRDSQASARSFHGQNGLGDARLPDVHRQAETLDAASFIQRTVRAHPHQVTVVTVARLTNLARALLFDPGLSELVGRVVVMGGAAFVPGNVNAVAEANIAGDPEAADVVFRSGIPLTMVGLDVTLKTRLTRQELHAWTNPEPYARVLREATAFYLDAYERHDPASSESGCPLHDPLAVAVAEDPKLIQTVSYPTRVETRGLFTDGMTVVDGRRPGEPGGIDVAVDVDADRFLTRFRERLFR